VILAHAKVNLALVVGGLRPDGLHELASVVQRVDLADELELDEADELTVEGFDEDTLVRGALERLAAAAGVGPRWRVRIGKRIPVAAGLGGGSADAAAALLAANATLPKPLPPERLRALAAEVGSDVPFFCEPGPKLVEGAGERLTPIELPQDYAAVVALPHGVGKRSTAEVYRRFDELGGSEGFAERRAALEAALTEGDLAALPPNDLARAAPPGPVLDVLRAAGAFRADLTGAGPALYGLFHDRETAEATSLALRASAETWVAQPVW
jgi:4-diphosphocytidyl-2-C-methyl-D-erythritol kinase